MCGVLEWIGVVLVGRDRRESQVLVACERGERQVESGEIERRHGVFYADKRGEGAV